MVAISVAALMTLAQPLAAAQDQGPDGQRIEQRVSDGAHAGKSSSRKQQPKEQQWKKGGRYAGKGAKIANPGRHGLKAAPKGHRWVRDGKDFLLVATATGIIASVVHAR
jgi:Ni/Co efflux regulator RcnB